MLLRVLPREGDVTDMRPDELVALASAHGIDLQHVAGAESNTKGLARKRRMGKEERKLARGRPIVETAEGSGSRVMRARAWSHAETGMAAFEVPRMPWIAALYSWSGDRDAYKELHRGLTLKALEMAAASKWIWQVPLLDGHPTYYLERLTELVLDEEGCKAYFQAAPGLYAIYMGVAEETWHKPLFGYFAELQAQYGRWLDTTRGYIARWIKAQELRDDSERVIVPPELSNAT